MCRLVMSNLYLDLSLISVDSSSVSLPGKRVSVL